GSRKSGCAAGASGLGAAAFGRMGGVLRGTVTGCRGAWGPGPGGCTGTGRPPWPCPDKTGAWSGWAGGARLERAKRPSRPSTTGRDFRGRLAPERRLRSKEPNMIKSPRTGNERDGPYGTDRLADIDIGALGGHEGRAQPAVESTGRPDPFRDPSGRSPPSR